MGGKEEKNLGLVFMRGKKYVINKVEDKNEFYLEETLNMGMFPDTSETKVKLSGVELQHMDNKDDDIFEPGNDEDMNDLAQASADNAINLGSLKKFSQTNWMEMK